MKAVVAAFNQEKALVGAFSVITNLRMELSEALICIQQHQAQAVLGKLKQSPLSVSLELVLVINVLCMGSVS